MTEVRVRDVLVGSTLWSRRELRKLRAKATVGDELVPLEQKLDLGDGWKSLEFQGVALRARLTVAPVFLLHKPLDCITSRRSEGGAATVFDWLEDPLAEACQPVGRLDRDTSGVLLFAADGQLLHRLTHPRYGIARSYRARLEAPLSDGAIQALLAGEVELDDGHRPQPTRLERVGDDQVEVELREGKYHEVRRMFAACGAPVAALHRFLFAGLGVGGLQAGESRRLTRQEVGALCTLTGYEPPEDFLEVEEEYDGGSDR